MEPGSIVRCRRREWVLMPTAETDIIPLRPLTGASHDLVHIHRQLMELVQETIPSEAVTPASFPFPTPDDISNASSLHLLWHAARLALREGAAPLRVFGRLAIRPRPYQLVPLLMALRLDPVRLFIADDVGVGKTIEALLIARELLERGEIRRFCVLCPPALCEQWASELTEKFNLDPVIIRPGTIGQLERQVPAGSTFYEQFPVQVISIDFAKTDRHRALFLNFCPELVIVDEAHGAAAAARANQQDRHELLKKIAQDPKRHLILLTATPHSGLEDSFQSLLGLLHPEFGNWNLHEMNETQRTLLARHFVQRTRSDIATIWKEQTCFPTRESRDESYFLSPAYRTLFEKTYEFCATIVRTGENLEKRRRRVRYWGALALLCCVMSSPEAAARALDNRLNKSFNEEDLDNETIEGFSQCIFEPSQDRVDDELPSHPIGLAASTLLENEKERLTELQELAHQVRKNHQDDVKLTRTLQVVKHFIQDGFHPILWCRYVATADYLAGQLRNALPTEVQVLCLTGRMGNDEREARIATLETDRPRVLVATDCLSEGVNLQNFFTAVIHYDLPWNPNRLEQREGRVDRYGQKSERVRVVRLFGQDNPVDGVLLKVLLDKAREIHRTLGTYVPVPEAGETVTQAVLEALFLRREQWAKQWASNYHLSFDPDSPEVARLHEQWEQHAHREKTRTTRFTQRVIKVNEVAQEMDTIDTVLGSPADVRDFFLAAAHALNISVTPEKTPGVFRVSLSTESLLAVPEPLRSELSSRRGGRWRITFEAPPPGGVDHIGRNHPFIELLAHFIFERMLSGQKIYSGPDRDHPDVSQPSGSALFGSRCGVIRTTAVTTLTTIFLLRARYLLIQRGMPTLLCEEVLSPALTGLDSPQLSSLPPEDILRLLSEARPAGNIPLSEKRAMASQVLSALGDWGPEATAKRPWGAGHPVQNIFHEYLTHRAEELTQAHMRLRRAIRQSEHKVKIRLQPPPDLLGFLVLQPAT